MHEDMISKTLVRDTVLKLTPAEFKEVKEAYHSGRLHKQQDLNSTVTVDTLSQTSVSEKTAGGGV